MEEVKISLEKCIGLARAELVELLGKQKATSRAQVGSRQSAAVAEACSGTQVSAGTGHLRPTQGSWTKWQISADTLTIGRPCAGYGALVSASRRLQKFRQANQGCKVLEAHILGLGWGWGRLSWWSSHTAHPQPTPEAEGAPLPPASPSRAVSEGGASALTQKRWEEPSPPLTELRLKGAFGVERYIGKWRNFCPA